MFRSLVELPYVQDLFAIMIAALNPFSESLYLRGCYLFGRAFENASACFKTSEKVTNRGDALTAATTRPRTPAKSFITCGGM
jgi:hypothetical protein